MISTREVWSASFGQTTLKNYFEWIDVLVHGINKILQINKRIKILESLNVQCLWLQRQYTNNTIYKIKRTSVNIYEK